MVGTTAIAPAHWCWKWRSICFTSEEDDSFPHGRYRKPTPRSHHDRESQPLAARKKPLSAATRPQPRGLASMGGGGLYLGAAAGQAPVRFHRLFHVPLVPRHGAGVLRKGSGGGRPASTRSSSPSRWIGRSGPTSTGFTCPSCQVLNRQGGWPLTIAHDSGGQETLFQPGLIIPRPRAVFGPDRA